ncbi:MAG: SIMPL domain-containing protein [Patescibacteria group bacterium]
MFENFKEKTKEYKILFLLFIAIVSCLFIVLIVSGIFGIINKIKFGDERVYRDTISIQGQGKVYAKPDIAIINLSVITEGKYIKDVQDRNTRKMNGVIDFLKSFGIEEKDIKTINYNIYPKYVYQEGVVPWISGYEINQTLEVKIRNLEKIGEILEKSVSAGINQVSSLRFWVDKDEDLKEQARKLAIEDAKKKADKLASNLGIKLVKLTGFTEDTGYYPVPLYREGIGGGGETPTIETGENEIIVNVSLIYEID